MGSVWPAGGARGGAGLDLVGGEVPGRWARARLANHDRPPGPDAGPGVTRTPSTSSCRRRSGSSSGSARSRSAARTRTRSWPRSASGLGVGLAVLWSLRRRRDRAEREARAMLEQRLAIARELHDVVAHHVSVIGIQAAAARRTLGRSPAETAAALTAIEASSRAAVLEMQRLVTTLRQPTSRRQRGTGGARRAAATGPEAGGPARPVTMGRPACGSNGRASTPERLALASRLDPGGPLSGGPGGPDERAPPRRAGRRRGRRCEAGREGDAVDRERPAHVARPGTARRRAGDPRDARAHARGRRDAGRRPDGRRRLLGRRHVPVDPSRRAEAAG